MSRPFLKLALLADLMGHAILVAYHLHESWIFGAYCCTVLAILLGYLHEVGRPD